VRLKVSIDTDIELLHVTGKQIILQDNIVKEYDEFSEEYETICEEYKSLIGYERHENKTKFDEELLKILAEDLKKEQLAGIDKIMEVIKTVYKDPKQNSGYVQIQTAVVNVRDFSCIRIKKFDVRISKR
jgi:hypothetical protein